MPEWTATPVSKGQPIGEPRQVTAPDASDVGDAAAVPEGPIAKILDWVDYDPDRAKAALTVEMSRAPDDRRKGVIEPLTKQLNPSNPEG